MELSYDFTKHICNILWNERIIPFSQMLKNTTEFVFVSILKSLCDLTLISYIITIQSDELTTK
jgi:hypothetical protein